MSSARIVPLKKNVLAVHTYCQDLSNSMYKDELMQLAKRFRLPTTSKSTKKELCEMLSRHIIDLADKRKMEGPLDLSEHLKDRLENLYETRELEPPRNWWQLF